MKLLVFVFVLLAGCTGNMKLGKLSNLGNQLYRGGAIMRSGPQRQPRARYNPQLLQLTPTMRLCTATRVFNTYYVRCN